jgi:hypothetical protein
MMRPGNQQGPKQPPMPSVGQQTEAEGLEYQQGSDQAQSFLADYMIKNGVPPEVALNPAVASQVAQAQGQG